MSARRNTAKATLMAGALLATSGCGFTGGSGPSAGALLSQTPGTTEPSYRVVQITPAILAAPAQAAGTEAAQPASAGSHHGYRIMPGDVLNVVIFERADGGLFSPPTSGGTQFPGLRVDEGGRIVLPYAGQVRVAGTTLAGAAQRIGSALSGTAVDPRIHVQLVSSTAHSVLVSGEVRTPGRVTLLDGPLTVLDAVSRAGGPSQPAHLLDVAIHNGSGTRRMAYTELMRRPQMPARLGDQIVLEHNDRRFLAMGAVRRPGLQSMAATRMSLLDGLGAAGGLNDGQAAPSGVFLLRTGGMASGGTVQPTLYHLDMARGDSLLLARSFPIQPEDVIYVTNAPVWEVQKFLSPFTAPLNLGLSGIAAAN